jgi:putative DNA primase/helicase
LKEIDADINIINVKNGLYEIANNKLLKHTPEYLSISQKPIVYNKRSMPKLFGKFLIQVLYRKDVKTAIDAMAYTFHRDYPIEILFILVGIGSNGKTVFTSLICSLLGVNNVSNVSLPAIINNRFAIADLENKDVNIDNELPGNVITETSIIKKLTGGRRQEIRIERKREHAYDAVLWAKLFFNANKVPDSTDTSSAYYRRIVPIAFPYQFEGKREDRQLLAKLTREEELSGIFNILISHLRRILKNNEIHLSESTI